MPWDDDLDVCTVLVPVDIVNTPGALVSITAGGVDLPEDPNPAWVPGATYGLGDRVHSLATHRVYESLKAGNTGKDPTLDANRKTVTGTGTWWFDVSATNRSAAFDSMASSQTLAPSPVVITLRPGAFNGFALFGIEADEYAITAHDIGTGNPIYSEPETSLGGLAPDDYYEYFFSPYKPLTQFVRTGIAPYGASEITLTLTKGSGNVKLGMFAIGDMRAIGIPQRDAEITPMDFSYFSQDAYGNATIRKRPNGTGMTITTKMDKEDAGLALGTIKEVLGTPVVVSGSAAKNFEWMTVFGLISASMSPDEYPFVSLKVTVRALI